MLNEAEKARYQGQAARDGKSLGAWLREAAEEKLALVDARGPLDSPELLVSFFAACDAREEGREPDWEEHQRMIERSRSQGFGES